MKVATTTSRKYTPELRGTMVDTTQATYNIQNDVTRLSNSIFGGQLTPIYPVKITTINPYQMLATDVIVSLTLVGGGQNVLLPSAQQVNVGQHFTLKDSSGGGFTVTPVKGETIDGSTSLTEAAYAVVHLVSNGTEWMVV